MKFSAQEEYGLRCLLAIAEEDKAERRRYALLQATIVQLRAYPLSEPHRAVKALNDAEGILELIEKREQEKSSAKS